MSAVIGTILGKDWLEKNHNCRRTSVWKCSLPWGPMLRKTKTKSLKFKKIKFWKTEKISGGMLNSYHFTKFGVNSLDLFPPKTLQIATKSFSNFSWICVLIAFSKLFYILFLILTIFNMRAKSRKFFETLPIQVAFKLF